MARDGEGRGHEDDSRDHPEPGDGSLAAAGCLARLTGHWFSRGAGAVRRGNRNSGRSLGAAGGECQGEVGGDCQAELACSFQRTIFQVVSPFTEVGSNVNVIALVLTAL